METQHIFRRAREAARALNRTASERIDRLLLALADDDKAAAALEYIRNYPGITFEEVNG